MKSILDGILGMCGAECRMPSQGCLFPKRRGLRQNGFLMALEAVSAILLLLIASLTLPIFSQTEDSPGTFFLCADAALALSKKGSFSSGTLKEDVESISSLSGMCLEAKSGSAYASACGGEKAGTRGEVVSLSMPAYDGLLAGRAHVRCWRG